MSKQLTFPPSQASQVMSMLREVLEKEPKRIYSTNAERCGEMQTAYELLAQMPMVNEIDCHLRDGMRSIGEIEFVCDELQVQTDVMPNFVKALSLASNLCVYGIKGGRIKCGLSFNDVLIFERDHF